MFGLIWGEWYRYFVFEALLQHWVHTPAIWTFPAHVVGRFGVALVVMAAGTVLVGMVAASWTGRLHTGGYVNALMPRGRQRPAP